MRAFIAVLTCASMGCASLVPATPRSNANVLGAREGDREKCDELDSGYTTWGAVAAGAGFLAGTGGVGTLAALQEDDMGKTDKTVSWALGGVSILVGLTSAVSVFVSQRKATKFSDMGCSEILRPGGQ